MRLSGEDVDRLRNEVDPRRRRLLALGLEDGRWTRRLAHLYAHRLDWHYLRQRTNEILEETEALQQVEREVRRS